MKIKYLLFIPLLLATLCHSDELPVDEPVLGAKFLWQDKKPWSFGRTALLVPAGLLAGAALPLSQEVEGLKKTTDAFLKSQQEIHALAAELMNKTAHIIAQQPSELQISFMLGQFFTTLAIIGLSSWLSARFMPSKLLSALGIYYPALFGVAGLLGSLQGTKEEQHPIAEVMEPLLSTPAGISGVIYPLLQGMEGLEKTITALWQSQKEAHVTAIELMNKITHIMAKQPAELQVGFMLGQLFTTAAIIGLSYAFSTRFMPSRLLAVLGVYYPGLFAITGLAGTIQGVHQKHSQSYKATEEEPRAYVEKNVPQP